MNSNPKNLTVAQAAAELGVCTATVRSYARTEMLASVRGKRNQLLIVPSSIVALAAHLRPGAARSPTLHVAPDSPDEAAAAG